MKLKKVCLLLVLVLFLLLLSEITCIANYNHEKNLITDEDRRAAESYGTSEDKNKRGLYEAAGSHNRHQTHPSGYEEAATFTSAGYTHGANLESHYYPSTSNPTGHGSYGLLSGLGGSYGFGHSAGGGSYGYGHNGGGGTYGYGHNGGGGTYGYGHSGIGGSYGYGGHTGLEGNYAHGGSYGHEQTAPSHGQTGHKALALKGLLIPLAGIALLGAAAALSANPVLLQLGVVNGRRRRRSLNSDSYPANTHKAYSLN